MRQCINCGRDIVGKEAEIDLNGYCMKCYNKRQENIKKLLDTPPEFIMQKSYEQGWVCPKCGAVMSPREKYCPFCSPAQKTEFWC